MNILFKKTYNTFLHKNYFSFTEIISNTNLYKIGGIPDHKGQSLNGLGTRIFGNDVINGFINAYSAILEGFEQNDRDMLKENLSPLLMSKFKPMSVQLVNEKSSVTANISRITFAIGATFGRNESNNSIYFMNNLETSTTRLGMSTAFKLDDPRSLIGLSGISVLSIFEVYFTSALKLIPKGSQVNSTPETHMLQFEIENNLSFTKLPSLMQKATQSISGGNNQETVVSLFKELAIGNDYSWKIGDVDKVLSGNIQIKEFK